MSASSPSLLQLQELLFLLSQPSSAATRLYDVAKSLQDVIVKDPEERSAILRHFEGTSGGPSEELWKSFTSYLQAQLILLERQGQQHKTF